MNKAESSESVREKRSPLWFLAWPFVTVLKALHANFLSYIFSSVLKDDRRIYSIKFVWYADSVYWHPMIWGSLVLYGLSQTTLVGLGWLLLLWFVALFVCYLTIMYNFNLLRAMMLAVGVIAFLGLAHFSRTEYEWNPLTVVEEHITNLKAGVTPGFFIVSTYFFVSLIACEVVWAWLFHRVELDESYVYERRFLMGTFREPIFARGLRRETKDLLELLLFGAADITHRTKNGVKSFRNVPLASLWLGTAIDSMLDYRRRGQIDLEKSRDSADENSRIDDAFHEEAEIDESGFADAHDAADDVDLSGH